ncbi:MAG: hypothetical protein WA609_00605 [Terriglobales bacterium]
MIERFDDLIHEARQFLGILLTRRSGAEFAPISAFVLDHRQPPHLRDQ